MDDKDKPLVWLHGEVKTPPFSQEARVEAGVLLRRFSKGRIWSYLTLDPCPVLLSSTAA